VQDGAADHHVEAVVGERHSFDGLHPEVIRRQLRGESGGQRADVGDGLG